MDTCIDWHLSLWTDSWTDRHRVCDGRKLALSLELISVLNLACYECNLKTFSCNFFMSR